MPSAPALRTPWAAPSRRRAVSWAWLKGFSSFAVSNCSRPEDNKTNAISPADRAFSTIWRAGSGATPAGTTRKRRQLGNLVASRSCLENRSGRLFEVPRPFAEGGKSVHPGTMGKGTLAGGEILAAPAPGLEGRCLESPAIGEGQVPWELAHRVHQREMMCRLLIALAAGEKGNSGHGGRNGAFEDAQGLFGHLLRCRLLPGVLAGNDHVRLENDGLQPDAGDKEFIEEGIENPFGNRGAAVDVMARDRTIHQHLGFDDRNNILLLAQSGVTGKRMSVGSDTIGGGEVAGDVDDGPPFGEAGAQPMIFLEPLAQTVETFGDLLTWRKSQGFRAGVDLDAGHRARCDDDVGEGLAAARLLAKRLIEENDARDAVAHRI